MHISEVLVKSEDEFITKILMDVLQRQENLFLKISSTNRSEDLHQVEQLLKQMDIVYTTDSNGFRLVVKKTVLNLFRDKISSIIDSQEFNQELDAIVKKNDIFWKAGRFEFNISKKPLIYGILNVTPDSFYDGGWYENESAIHERISEMISSGVDVIEIGGQTTRPGFHEISAKEELKRIQSVIRFVKDEFKNTAIAVDTYKYEVMRQITDDVDIINDVNAFTDDQRKIQLLKQSNVGLLTMHSAREKNYVNLTDEMKNFFEKNLKELVDGGIEQNRIALDQGIGYAKVADGYQDYAMMKNIDQFNYLHRPMMVAISRKGFGAKLFGLKKEDRLAVTLIAEAYMYLHGGRILRVHDIEETVQLVKMLDVIENGYWFGK